MLAQRQPSFKECVTAHWSSDLAPKIIGAQAYPDVPTERKQESEVGIPTERKRASGLPKLRVS